MSVVIAATVPVFSRYLGQIRGIVSKAGPEDLEARLVPDGFTAREHFGIAQGYVLRSLWPVLGCELPQLEGPADAAALIRRGERIAGMLAQLRPQDFDEAETREITHRAGKADLRQPAEEYVMLYGLPNFLFNLSQGYALLRARGVAVGKADFDGFHHYPAGFSSAPHPASGIG